MKAIFRKIQHYPRKAEFRYATGRTFSRARNDVCGQRTCQHLRISVMPVRTSPVESWGSENITISANARASEVGGSEARRDRVGEDMGLKTGGWSPLADGWGCVRDYIRHLCPPVSHPRGGSLNNASHSSSSDYLVSCPARMTTREVSSLAATISSVPPSWLPRYRGCLLLPWLWFGEVGGSNDGEEERAVATTCVSKRSEDMYYFEGVWRAIENDRRNHKNRRIRGYIHEMFQNCLFYFYQKKKSYLLHIRICTRSYPDTKATIHSTHQNSSTLIK